MIEYKTERVDPRYEDNTLEINASFGWQLIESQEIYNESTRITGVNVKSYNAFMQGFTGNDGKVDVQTYTDVTNYIAMRFGRDTQMANYEKIKDLENSFYANMNIAEPKKPKILTAITVIGIILIVISIIMAIAEGTAAEIWEIAVCIIFPIVFIPITIYAWKSYNKRQTLFTNALSESIDILAEARSIIDGQS